MQRLLLIPLLFLSSCTSLHSNSVVPNNGVVVSASSIASDVGSKVIAEGGNAVDAAVATAFALAVTFPEAGNIGGGGFMLIHFPDARPPVVIDYRETAPAAVNEGTFFEKEDRTPYRLAGVPGTVRGLALAHEKYGKLPWHRLIEPAIALAKDGFAVNSDLAGSLQRALKDQTENKEFTRVFAPPNQTWKQGDRLTQPDLAQSLRLIAEKGPDAFYTGEIAKKIVAEMDRGDGLIRENDLATYQPRIREPIHGTFNGYDIYAPPPPSSGGIALVEMLNLIERTDLKTSLRYSEETIRYMTEVMKRAYADRAKYLGDPSIERQFPFELTSKEYACIVDVDLHTRYRTPSAEFAPEIPLRNEPEQTTHFSVIDATGMAVANTYTLEQSFGGKIVVTGAGFLLNNELGDFNPQPGITTKTGQIGTAPNIPAPQKRPLSSMCPTIVTQNGKVIIITGSPGGRTIINTVFCILVNRLVYDMPPRQSIDAPRHHHQWLPDQIQIEPELAKDYPQTIKELREGGYTVDPTPRRQGDAHSIFYDPATTSWIGVPDRRRATDTPQHRSATK